MDDLEQLRGYELSELLAELKARKTPPAGLAAGAAPPVPPARDAALAAADTVLLVEAVREQQKVIYGVDNRRDVFESLTPAVRRDVDSVVSLIRVGNLSDNGNGTTTIQAPTFKDEQLLCSSERFGTQPVAAFCSGVLVATDIIATAAHCLRGPDDTLQGFRFVFGFHMISATQARMTVPNTEIYQGVSILGFDLTPAGTDWTLIKLDRPVTNHRVGKIRRNGTIRNQQLIHVIGHPVGLPAKIAAGANVRDNSPQAFFVANLDTYGGNSGSPVFNAQTHEVEGLLVRGETDFAEDNGCFVSLVCPTTGCRGEDVTRSTEFSNLVP